jgi:hypothetical protein
VTADLSPRTAKEILLAIAARMERCGWTRGTLGSVSKDGPACLLGHFVAVCGPTTPLFAKQQVEMAFKRTTDGRRISEWNDDWRRTSTEVLRTVRNLADTFN